MKIDILHIFEQDSNATLTAYVRDNPQEMSNDPRRAILICPGGAYEYTSARESEPIALTFLARGYNAFVLDYSVKASASDLRPATEAVLSIKHIRENAEKYNIDPDKIFILGFSAGGHVALSCAALYDEPQILKYLSDAEDMRIGIPNGVILCYPVVTATCKTHMLSLYNFCGSTEPEKDKIDLFCLEKHISSSTPPMFIWHTTTDDSVPVRNSLLLYEALLENGVQCEMHIFSQGYHGLSLATHETCHDVPENAPLPASQWVDLADIWVKNLK